MRNAIVVLLGALTLAACAKDKPAENVGMTTTTRGAAEPQTNVQTEQVRSVLLNEHPSKADTIRGLIIMNDGNVITLRGKVHDEATKAALIDRVRSMPNVRGIRDELQVVPKTAEQQQQQQQPQPQQQAQQEPGAEPYGTTTTTGATGPGEEPAKGEMSKSDAVRKNMEKARPKAASLIQGLTITEDGQDVTIKGTVPDAETHRALLKAAKETPGVKSVQDEMKVQEQKKEGLPQQQQMPRQQQPQQQQQQMPRQQPQQQQQEQEQQEHHQYKK